MQRDIDEVEVLLDMWAIAMRSKQVPVDQYPSESHCFINSWRKDFDEMCEEADLDTIAKVDAAYDSLPGLYQDPILRRYSLGYRAFARPATFDQAKVEIRKKFVIKGLL